MSHATAMRISCILEIFSGSGVRPGSFTQVPRAPKMELTTGPERIFKLCVADESARFQAAGTIRSELDAADGFIHLSDRTSAPVVAGLFFSTAKDLRLIELASSKLAPLSWVVGKMGDAAPTPAEGELAIHYLIPEGCVHVFGAGGVPTSAIVREEAVPLGADGKHVFPDWL